MYFSRFQADGAMYGTDSIKRVEMVANPEGGGGPYKRVPKWKGEIPDTEPFSILVDFQDFII